MPDIVTFNRLAEILGVDLNYFSEHFRSADDEMPSTEHSNGKSTALPSGNRQHKTGWNMSRGNWTDADFSGLKNLHERFSSSNMQRCKFVGSQLAGLLLKSNNVDRCDFSGSDISNSHFQRSNLVNNLFKNCSLKHTEFSGSFVARCDLSGADFTGVMVKNGGFEKNTFTDAIWNRTSFIAVHLVDVVFTGTLEDCSFENCSFDRVTFRNASIIKTFFKNKSLKRIRFIDCAADRLTYEFLKNGKADLTGITLISQEGGNES